MSHPEISHTRIGHIVIQRGEVRIEVWNTKEDDTKEPFHITVASNEPIKVEASDAESLIKMLKAALRHYHQMQGEP